MRIEDLPPWAQAQAANQIMARQRRNNGRSRPPSPALSDDEEEMPRRAASKYHNRKAARITAAGNILEFDSQKEARRYDELALLLAAGKIRDLKLQPPEIRLASVPFMAYTSENRSGHQRGAVLVCGTLSPGAVKPMKPGIRGLRGHIFLKVSSAAG